METEIDEVRFIDDDRMEVGSAEWCTDRDYHADGGHNWSWCSRSVWLRLAWVREQRGTARNRSLRAWAGSLARRRQPRRRGAPRSPPLHSCRSDADWPR